MITKTKTKELEKLFGTDEVKVLKSYEKGDFEKYGIRGNCRKLVEEYGGKESTYKVYYSKLLKYGAFDKYFPERKAKKKYIQVSFRMSEELHKALKKRSRKVNKSLNRLITQAVKRSLR